MNAGPAELSRTIVRHPTGYIFRVQLHLMKTGHRGVPILSLGTLQIKQNIFPCGICMSMTNVKVPNLLLINRQLALSKMHPLTCLDFSEKLLSTD